MRFLALVAFVLALATSQSILGQEPLPTQPATAPPAGETPAQPPAGQPPVGELPAGQAPACEPAAATTPEEQSYRQMVGYTLGMNFGHNLRQSEIVVDLQSLVAGISDALKGEKPRYTEEQLGAAMQKFRQEMQQKTLARMEAVKRAGAAFLAENKTKPGSMEEKKKEGYF